MARWPVSAVLRPVRRGLRRLLSCTPAPPNWQVPALSPTIFPTPSYAITDSLRSPSGPLARVHRRLPLVPRTRAGDLVSQDVDHAPARITSRLLPPFPTCGGCQLHLSRRPNADFCEADRLRSRAQASPRPRCATAHLPARAPPPASLRRAARNAVHIGFNQRSPSHYRSAITSRPEYSHVAPLRT